MQKCGRETDETLVLDILGELNDPSRRGEWEDHLKGCAECRMELERMRRLIGAVRRTGTPPELTASQARAMADTVGWRLRNERTGRSDRSGRRSRLIPALAAACALFVALIFGYRMTDGLLERPWRDDLATELNLQDLEVIDHLELLKNMDTIEKLIHVVDLPPNGMTPDEEEGHQDDTGEASA